MLKPLLSSPIPVRMPLEVLKEIEAIAKVSDRSRSWVIVRALKLYLDGEGKQILAAADGRSEVIGQADAIVRGNNAGEGNET